MLKPIIISFKIATCQLLYLTNTYKPREILLTIIIKGKVLGRWVCGSGFMDSLNQSKLFSLQVFTSRMFKVQAISFQAVFKTTYKSQPDLF